VNVIRLTSRGAVEVSQTPLNGNFR
jgi:hypothetical protein